MLVFRWLASALSPLLFSCLLCVPSLPGSQLSRLVHVAPARQRSSSLSVSPCPLIVNICTIPWQVAVCKAVQGSNLSELVIRPGGPYSLGGALPGFFLYGGGYFVV